MPVLRFDNSFTRELPGDPLSDAQRRQVHGALYSRVTPTPVASPRLLAWSREVLADLGLSEADAQAPWFAEVFAGNRLLEGMEPYSANYGGHQFGNWAGQLGDGRAILLGEIVARAEGAPIARVLRRRVFAPLGMDSTDLFDLPHADLTTGYHRAPSEDARTHALRALRWAAHMK